MRSLIAILVDAIAETAKSMGADVAGERSKHPALFIMSKNEATASA
jgi:hypothetical protein